MSGHKTSLACLTKMYGQSYGKTQVSVTAMILKRGHVMCSQKSLPGASLQPLVHLSQDTPYICTMVRDVTGMVAKIPINNSIKGCFLLASHFFYTQGVFV